MPKYHVERSIVIEKPIKEVRDSLKNFKEWPKWSPWIIMEPDATLTYSDRQGQVGATYGWAGVLVGAGAMELMDVRDNTLKMQITFIKPFKSTADVGFKLVDRKDSTHVTWYMDGSLPFFLFWMTGKMKTFIGMDYERGLHMIKEYLEVGNVASFVHIEGKMSMKEQKYVGIPNTCALKEINTHMKRDFDTLYAFMDKNNISPQRVPFSIYHTFDMFNGVSSYVACVPLDEEIEIDSQWVRGTVSSSEVLKTIHKGRYLHLGNAWMTAISFARMKKMKMMKSPVGYEFYPNNPYDTAEEELVTVICIPLK